MFYVKECFLLLLLLTWVDGVGVLKGGQGNFCQCNKMGEEVEVAVHLVVETSDQEVLVFFVREDPGPLLLNVVDEGKILEQKVTEPIADDVFTLSLKRPVLVDIKVKP